MADARYNIMLFTQPTCAPCRAVKAALAAEDILEIDVWKHPLLATYHRVTTTPTVLVVDCNTAATVFRSTETNSRKLIKLLEPFLAGGE